MPSVDRRVLEMKFDNAAFERGVAQTMQSIDKLKGKLNFDGATKNLSSLQAAGNKFDMSGMGQGVDEVASRFSALQVAGVTALATLVNKAVNAGLQFSKAFTLGPVGQGFSDYNTKLTSVQTIMNSTGADIKEVNGYFNQLDTYADKTIYNLTDMTSAFAKFINAGIDMKTAVPMIKGIANMTALAGQGAEAAQIAYYNLSQSLSGGFLTTIDFKSLNLANIATKQWKQEVIKAALAAGTLQKSADGVYHSMNPGQKLKKAYTEQSLFTEGLSEQWATTEVLTKVLGKYGDITTDLGRKAQAAAQNVKSIPMLLDTLKEAIGTSWTSSFEFILGNVTQSTKLFTDASNALGKIIGDMGQARNHMLHAWQSEGGRTAIIDSIKNVWHAFGAVLKPIGEAFRNIFPSDHSVSKLAKLSFMIRTFTHNLIIGSTTGDNLRRTFQGVFSLLKIGMAILSGLGKGFFKLFSIVTGGAGVGISSLLELTAKLGDFITGIQKWLSKTGAIKAFFAVLTSPLKTLKPSIDIVAKLASALSDLVTGNVSGFKSKIGGIGGLFKGMFADILQGYHDFTQALSDGFSKIEVFLKKIATRAKNSGNLMVAGLATAGAKIAHVLSAFTGNASAAFGNLISSITGVTVKGQNFLSGFGSGAIGGILSVVHSLGDAFDNLKAKMNFDPVLASFNTGMGGASSTASGAMSALNSVLTVLKDIWSTIFGVFGNIAHAFAPIFTSIRDFFTTIVDKITEGIRGADSNDAIAAFDATVLVGLLIVFKRFVFDISGIFKDIRKLVQSAGGVFNQLTDNLKTMQRSVKADILLKIAISVGILVAALYVLTKIDPEKLGVALGGITVLFAELAATMIAVSKYGMKANTSKIAATGAAMVLLATSIAILAGAVAILSTLSWEEMLQGLVGVGLILSGLGLFTKFAGLGDGGVRAGAGLMLMAVAINILTIAVKAIADMKIGNIVKAALTIDYLLATLVAAARGMEGTLKGSAATFIMASALALLTPVLVALGFLPYENLAKGLGSVAIALGIMAVTAKLMTKAVPGAVAMIAMAKAIFILAPALFLLGTMSWESLAKGVGTLAVTLLLLAGVTLALTKALPGAAALVIIAGALAMLVPVIIILGLLPWKVLLRGVAGLALVLAVLIGAVIALTPVIGIMILATKAIALLGAATLLAGLGFLAFSAGLASLAVSGAAGFAVLVAGVVSFLAVLPLIGRQVGYAFVTFATVIGASAPVLIQAFTKIVMEWLKSMQTLIPEMVRTVGIIMSSIVQEVRRRAPEFFAAGLDMIIGFLEAIRSRIDTITNLVIDIFVAFINAVRQRLPNIIQAGIDFLISFLNGLAQGIRDHNDEIFAAGVNIASAIIEGIGRGLRNLGHLAREALEQLGQNLIDAFKRFFGINSPSKVFAELGVYLIQGLANGFSGAFHLVWDAVTDLGKKLPGWMQKVLGIKSPSKVFHELGGFVGEGFANGIDATSSIVRKATTGVGEDSITGMKKAMAKIGDTVSANMDTAPTIRPVLDLTDVEANAGKLGGMLAVDPLHPNGSYSKAQAVSTGYAAQQAAAAFEATKTQKALQALATAVAKNTQHENPRPVEFHIGTVQDGDSLLRRVRATNKMLSLAEGGDSLQMMGALI